jgi:hypothetical protein
MPNPLVLAAPSTKGTGTVRMQSANLSSIPDLSRDAGRIENAYSFLFTINAALLVLVPAGAILGINFKMIFFALLVPLAFSLQYSSRGFTPGKVAALVCGPIGIAFWVMVAVGYNEGFQWPLTQAKDIFALFGSAWFMSVYLSLAPGNPLKFIRLLVNLLLTSSLLKGAIFIYGAVTGTPASRIIQMISDAFHIVLVTVDFDSDYLGRFELLPDALLPLAIFAVVILRSKLRISRPMASIVTVILIWSAFITFSRYIWGFSVLALVLVYILPKWEKFHYLLLGVLGVVIVSTLPFTIEIIDLRVSDQYTFFSDRERADQSIVLPRFFMDAPIFGHGLGSYVHYEGRSNITPYAYENQLGALAGQIGIVGCAGMALLLFGYYFRASIAPINSTRYKAVLFLILVFWLYGGFVNPQIISSTGAVFFGFLLALLLTPERDDPIAVAAAYGALP